MTTVVNNPPAQNESGGNMTMIFGLIVLVIFGYLFFVYGLPALGNMQGGAPQINIPDKVDVNVQQVQP